MLVMFELRAIKKTISTLYRNIIDPYDADVFIACQRQFKDDDKNIELFDKKVIHKELYNKPDPHLFFNSEITQMKTGVNWANWNFPRYLQIYINFYKMSEVIKKYVNDYDYFIFTRTDIEVLFPFPDKELFEKLDKGIYSLDASWCSWFGGQGTMMYIHKDYILQFLTCCYDTIKSATNQADFFMLNQERFVTYSMKNQKLESILFNSGNFYYTVETLQDYSSWSRPHLHPVHNVLCKYDEQVNEAYANLKLWNEGYRWGIKNNTIMLIKE